MYHFHYYREADPRDKLEAELCIYLTVKDKKRLRKLAYRLNLSMAEIVRTLIKLKIKDIEDDHESL